MTDQPPFINVAIAVRLRCIPRASPAGPEVERALGRDRPGRDSGAAPIDIDLIAYDDLVLQSPA